MFKAGDIREGRFGKLKIVMVNADNLWYLPLENLNNRRPVKCSFKDFDIWTW